MGKDMHLVNIYLKIHNKRAITLDDLRYLAQYSPECFEKTCKNVIYNRPETKPIMAPETPTPTMPHSSLRESEQTERQHIEHVLDNLSLLEADSFPISQVNADEVKNLLGNLYMEMLFPHNDRDTFFQMEYETTSSFDCKA